MPGNPLPKIEINASRWPYDENGPANGKFGQVAVTPAPKSVFDADADSAPATLNGESGYLRMRNPNKYPLVDVPGGERGKMWEDFYAAKPSYFQDHEVHEMRMTLTKPMAHFWEYFVMYQPASYRVDAAFSVVASSPSDWDNSQAGDIFEKVANTDHKAELAEIGENGDTSGGKAAFINYNGHHSSWDQEVRNTRTGDTFTLSGARNLGWNNKFSIWWVDDSFTGTAQSGYSNQAFNVEAIADSSLDGSSKPKISRSTSSYPDGSVDFYNISLSNSLEPDPIETPYIWRTEENDSLVEFVIERKMESAEGAKDSLIRVWKKTNHPSGEYPEWSQIVESSGFGAWSTRGHDNVFVNGYLLGWANSGFRVDTQFGLKRHEIWDQKPTFLIEAGV